MTEGRLEARPIESAHFGRSVFAAALSTVEDARRLLDALTTLREALVVVRLPTEAMAAAQLLEGAGGRLCDVLVTMSRSSPPVPANPTAPTNFGLRRGSPGDAPALHGVGLAAFQGFVGHWHADERTAGALADALYAQWAADLARAATAERPLLVAEAPGGHVIGFLALASSHGARWHVPLAGVDPRYRGQGVLAALLEAGVREVAAGGDVHIDYETQLSNRAALRAVARCGLIPSSSRFTFHLWTTTG